MAAAQSLKGQYPSGTILSCGSESPLPLEATYRYQLNIPGTSGPSRYDFYLYMYSTQTATVKVYNNECNSVDIGEETYKGDRPPSGTVSQVTFSQEFLSTCQPTTYFIEVMLADTCGYEASVALQCSGEVACLDCNGAINLVCGATKTNTTPNKAKNVSEYCDQKNSGFAGGEVVYKITPKITQEFTFVLSDIEQGDDLDMFLLSSCDKKRDCLVTSNGNSSDDPDEITYELNANQTYYLVVDTDGTSGGGESDFTLRVTGCCTRLPQLDNNFLFIPTGENTATLKFIDNDNPSAMGAKNIRWSLGKNEIGQGSSVEAMIDSKKIERLCVNWDKEEAGFDRCFIQCKDICFPIDYSCNLINYLPIMDNGYKHQFPIPDKYFVVSWLLHDGSNDIEFRDSVIGNKMDFDYAIKEGQTYDVTVVYRENERSGCFKVCSRKFCIDQIDDLFNSSESKIQPLFAGSRDSIEKNGIYRYQLNYDLPTGAQFVKWQYYPVNKPEDVVIVEGGSEFVDLDTSQSKEYTICMIFEEDGCLRITCSDICLDTPYDVCIDNASTTCSSADLFVLTEPKCEQGRVEVSVNLPDGAEMLYWSNYQGQILQSNSTTIAVSSKGSRNSEHFVYCYYRICSSNEGGTFNNEHTNSRD